jgi:hypothetical protein
MVIRPKTVQLSEAEAQQISQISICLYAHK